MADWLSKDQQASRALQAAIGDLRSISFEFAHTLGQTPLVQDLEDVIAGLPTIAQMFKESQEENLDESLRAAQKSMGEIGKFVLSIAEGRITINPGENHG